MRTKKYEKEIRKGTVNLDFFFKIQALKEFLKTHVIPE